MSTELSSVKYALDRVFRNQEAIGTGLRLAARLSLFSLLFLSSSATAQTLSNGWSGFEQLSRPAPYVSEPKIAADLTGDIHVVWSERNEAGVDAILYTSWHDGAWDTPVDIMVTPGVNHAWVTDIEVDAAGILHLVWIGQNTLYYSSAHLDDARTAWGWETPLKLADGVARSGWGADMLFDAGGRLHLVYADGFAPRLYHIYSDDAGSSWSAPVLVGDENGDAEGTTETMLVQDTRGRLHVAWTTRTAPWGWPGMRAFYARSLDRGATWSEPLLVDSIDNDLYLENRGPFFLSLGLRGQDEVHLAWAGAPNGDRWHQWSQDGGENWSESRMILGAAGERYGTTGFLPMIEDPAGIFHLFTTFQASDGGLLTSIWQGTDWGQPSSLPFGTLNCEDPRVVITLGNQLHLVCVNEKGTGTPDEGVYHTWMLLDAPEKIPAPLPTSEHTMIASIIKFPTPVPMATHLVPEKVSNLPVEQAPLPAKSMSLLMAAVLPAVLLVLAVVVRQLTD